jgi:putative peptide zinc metalloprotease protein
MRLAERTHPSPDEYEETPRDSIRPTPRPDIELLGPYAGSGLKEPPSLVNTPHGLVQLSPLLYRVAELCDGRRNLGEIAREVGRSCGRGVSADNVRFLIEKKLSPLGIASLDEADTASVAIDRPNLLLALRFRIRLLPERAVNAIARILHPLFSPVVVLAMLGSLVALDVWLFFEHGIGSGMRQLLYDPSLMLMVLGLLLVSAIFHECGHATGCSYGGARPGAIGVGLYLVWPAFFAEVTNSFRLGRAGRLRVDLGGVYFTVIFALAVAGAYFLTGYEPLLVVILVLHLEALHQFTPFLRLDGYYVLSDLVGVPDLFARIKPTLLSLLPWRKTDDSVGELKWWARALITIWVCTVIPLLLLNLGLLVFYAPRLFATTWDSLRVLATGISASLAGGEFMSVVADSVKAGLLLLFLGGVVITFLRLGKRYVSAGLTRTQGRPVGRALFAGTTLVLLGVISVAWWRTAPRSPLRPGEEVTVPEATRAALGGDANPGGVLVAGGDESPVQAATDEVGAPAGETWATLTVAGELPPSVFALAPGGSPSLEGGSASQSATGAPEDSSSDPAGSPSPSPDASPSPDESPTPEASPSPDASPSPEPSPEASPTPESSPSSNASPAPSPSP